MSKIVFLIAALLVTACAHSSSQVRVFECRATVPFALEIEIFNSSSGLVMSQATFHSNQFDSVFLGKEYSSDSYHRAFVDEKSVMFNIDKYKVTLSDYRSEEFGEFNSVLSVTLEWLDKKEFYECQSDSSSHLSILLN